jgi:hypothetical protein
VTAAVTVYGTMLAAGLVSSLHCIGMCGPILLGFGAAAPARRPAYEFLWYHLGRIWTYALLGLLAGTLGRGVARGGVWSGWQRGAGIALSGLVLVAGLVLLLPAGRLVASAWIDGCGLGRLRSSGWFRVLTGSGGAVGRLVLGALMGFLPCGLVYAMLALAAALGGPLEGALGMALFGLGTVPALTAVVATSRLWPARLRAHGTRVAAIAIVATGAWMMARSLVVTPAPAGCPLCAPAADVTDRAGAE